MQAGSGARARLTSVVAAGALAAAALSTIAVSPANAAVMVSGSTVDAAGNYVDGTVRVINSASGSTVDYIYAQSGAFDIPLADGTYKLEFYPSDSEYADEYYRDKADYATADVITVAGAAQTLPAWTIDRHPTVTGVVTTSDGRPVDGADITAYDAATNNQVASDETGRDGVFVIGATAPVKLVFSGRDPVTNDLLATEFYNDKPSLGTADPVTPLAAGANVGTVALSPGGLISGRVTSEAGAPLQLVEVCIDDQTWNCERTNSAGIYTFEGVNTGSHTLRFDDPIGEYIGEYYNNVPLTTPAAATQVAVSPGQSVTGVDAALAAAPAAPANGVDVSGTVRDEIGGVGVGYEINLYDTPADPRDAEIVGSTISNRSGQYQFSQLDRIGGETEFKIQVVGDGPREEGDFARRTIWSGDKLGYETAVAITAAPRTLDFLQPVAGGISGTVTSEAGGVPDSPYVVIHDSDSTYPGYASSDFGVDGSYDERSLWAGEYTVQFGADRHVSEWWKDSLAGEATTVTVRPGQMTTGISAVLTKEVKAVERPEVKGNAWVGKTVRLDQGEWNTEAGSKFTFEWLSGTTVVATTPSLKITKSLLGKKLTGRVTNDAGFAQGQAITKTTPKVGYQPKLKANVSKTSAAITLKVKPLKAKKVKATVKVFEIVGTKKNGDDKLKALGKAKITNGKGVVRFKKALGKGKHKLVFSVKGKGKVGSGDIQKKVKLKR